MLFERTAATIRYTIDIPLDDFVAISDAESYKTNNACFEPGNSTLCEKLGAQTSAMDVEYNGHFGAAVYITLDVEDDDEKTWAEIEKVIADHIEWCHTL